MNVRNINGTSQLDCECGSWLEHWKNFSGQALRAYCPVVDCYGKPEVGAHVQKEASSDNRWFIVPLCKPHNGKTGETLTVSDSIALVPANVSETCGN